MRWLDRMYVGDSLKGKKEYYQHKITASEKATGTYCLIPAGPGPDLMVIVRSEALKDEAVYSRDVPVLGIAGSRREAFHLAGVILADVMEKTGTTDILSFFNLQEQAK